MDKIFSVKYLVESIVNPQYDGKTYEEVVMLIRADSSEMAAKKVIEHWRNLTKELTYENAVGGMTIWCFVQVLDCFELVDEIEGDIDFKEVYNRYILVEAGMTPDEVIRDYSLDK
ncbi:DUF4288 domain-containing protein [Sporosarcina luteola]|uniref:DUF4288 domain-containing protein n=1 Tax=Bacillales TaxID=1385 RepID=UPI00203F201C|nr:MULTISPECIES: DUF4288 domain-containing protein [Bacillales]MCM3639501.1 DUF4288 domain-containing protein [Sporosarcina luteola]